MDWSMATVWWIAAGLLVAAELASGTFYLLMLAVGACAGALAAHLGLGVSAQVVAAAVVGGAAVIVLNRRRRSPEAAPASSNPDMNLDIGQSVQVDAWSADGMAQVQYRGAAWQARFIGSAPARSGRHVIRAVEGSCLLLDR